MKTGLILAGAWVFVSALVVPTLHLVDVLDNEEEDGE